MSSEALTCFRNALTQVPDEAQARELAPASSTDSAFAPTTHLLSSTEESDESLLTRVGLGSQEALALLFRRHGRAVFNTAWRILRDRSEADDLRQDVFLYLFQKAKLFDATKGTAVSWIIQVAYHRAIDRRRHLEFRQHYDAQEFNEDRVQGRSIQPSTDTIDGQAILNRLRDQLSPDQRKTLELHIFEGYSLREVAEQSGQTVGNVRHHYYRALNRLRSSLFAEKRG